MTMNNTDLRKFGLTMGVVIVLLFGLLLPWIFDHGFPLWPWIPAGAFWLTAVAAPALLAPVYRGWMRFGHVLGWINTRIILGLMFFTVFLVVAVIMKLLRKDPLSRKLDKTLNSYRVPSEVRERNHMEKPF